MNTSLSGTVALVTGGAAGIGYAIAERFVSAGADVLIADVSESVVDAARGLGPAAVGVVADVSDADDVERLVQLAERRFGKLNVLCNNAGVDAEITSIVDTDIEEFDRLVRVNLRGVFLVTKYGFPALIRAGGGSIINIASVTALIGVAGQGAYSATKGGVVALTKVAAVEGGPHSIRANVIAPGVVVTPMWEALLARYSQEPRMSGFEAATIAKHPAGRLGRPTDLAAAAAFLAGDESSFITGVTLPVDGGMIAV